MSRTEKINGLLRSELANLISRDFDSDECLITITYVLCSSDLRYAKAGISVLPENKSGTALKNLRKHSSEFRNNLKKKLNLKYIPKINWIIDANERHALEIEEVLKKI